MNELSKDVESEVQRLEASQSNLEDWIDTEFNTIEQIFDQLFEKTDKMEVRFDDKLQSATENVRDMKKYVNSQKQLTELKNEANEHGISTAVCDHCSEDVDLRMLMEPRCPGCDRVISGVSPGSWVPFSSNRLETQAIQNSGPEASGESEEQSLSNATTDRPDENWGDDEASGESEEQSLSNATTDKPDKNRGDEWDDAVMWGGE